MSKDEKPPVQVKAFESFEIKDEQTGEVEAIIATLNVVDRDLEVITDGAIKNGSKVRMSAYGHDMVGFLSAGAAPVGKGAVFIEKDKAIFRGKMFMTTERGRETLSVLKEMGMEQEWSFGFHVLESETPDDEWRKQGAQLMLTKLNVFEVSPVLMGAGIGTQTVAAKEADEAAARVRAEEEAAAAKQAEDEAAAKKAEEDAAEAARLAAEVAATEEAQAAEAKRLADEAAATETQRLADEATQKARATVDLQAYRHQREFNRRLGVL